MRCETAQDLLIQRWLGEIEPDSDRDLAHHLAGCAACRVRETAQNQLDQPMESLRALSPLPPQGTAVMARLPGARRRLWLERAGLGAAGVAAAAVVTLAAMSTWEHLKPPVKPVPVVESSFDVIADPVPLPATFLETRKSGAGPVATAAVPTPTGQATAYFYLDAGSGGQMLASILLRHPDGSMTRELDLGDVTFGLAPFTQPEFRLLTAGGHTLLAIAHDDPGAAGAGTAVLRVVAYDEAHSRLLPLRFEGGRTTLPVSDWPAATQDGLQTRSGPLVTDWVLKSGTTLVKRQVTELMTSEPSGVALADAELTTPTGVQKVLLQGSLTDGAQLALQRSDGSVAHTLDLGRPHFGHTPLTEPRLHRLVLGDREVLAVLSDPMVGLPGHAVLRVFAYDPDRGRLRLVPFTDGEVLVNEAPAGSGQALLTRSKMNARSGATTVERRWLLTDNWLLEPAR